MVLIDWLINYFSHAISARNKVELAKRVSVLVCSVIKLVVGNSFMSHVHKLWVCFVKKLAIILIMSNIVDIVNITIQNWSATYTIYLNAIIFKKFYYILIESLNNFTEERW